MPFIRYALDTDALMELRHLVPDADVNPGSRRIILTFRGSRSALDFLRRIAEDVDLLIAAQRRWHFDATLDLLEDLEPKLRQHCGIDPSDLPAVIQCLRMTAAED